MKQLLRTLLVLLVLTVTVGALAQTVTIDTGGDPFARLELRTLLLPGGEERTIYVVSAERVELRQDELMLVASRLEFDPDAATARIVGRGRVERPDEVLVGEDIVVELEGGRLDGDAVVVITDTVYVVGDEAQRVDGRISVLNGRFAPCARCGQEVEDYAFTAERIEILPGDRLIAWNATLLIRDAPILGLPLLVLPIADDTRSPRLVIESGNERKRAEVQVDWPYVSGPNAYGTLTARLLIRVDPSEGGFLDSRLFGGRPDRIDLAGAIDHRFYDPNGAGRVTLAYVPELQNAAGEVTSERALQFEATYATDAASGDPSLAVRAARDDVARPDLLEVEASTGASLGTFRATLQTQLPIPLAPGSSTSPSWDDRAQARATPVRLTFAGTEASTLRLGPLVFDGLSVDVGAFEDQPDPTNRSSVGGTTFASGRVQAQHRLTLETLRILGSVELSGKNTFLGRYYGTGERQIDWSTSLTGKARAGSLAELSVTWNRAVAEGETPFAFERIALRSRADLAATLKITPWSGTTVTAEGGWVFTDNRDPDVVGWAPTKVTLETFGNIEALAFKAIHEANPRIGDIGTLAVEASVRLPSDRFVASVSGSHLQDLNPSEPETNRGGEPVDATNGSGKVELGVRGIVVASVETSWRVNALSDVADDAFRWEEVDVTASAGTTDRGDRIPNLEATWTFDPEADDLAATSRFGYEAAIDVGTFRAELAGAYGPAGGTRGTHRLSLLWDDLLRADLTGIPLFPGSVVGLAADPTSPLPVEVTLKDGGGIEGIGFEATYRTNLVPDAATSSGAWERRNSGFEATLKLAERNLFADEVQALVDAFIDVPLPDDAQPSAYVRRANVGFGMDVAGRVGLQGTLGYRGTYDASLEEVTGARLALEQVSLTVRATNELYVGATLNDIWEVVAEDPSDELQFDPRPTLFAAWDRCCWALYGQWDTRSGEVILTLGRPGSSEGRVLSFEDGPSIPWGTETP